MMSARLSGSLAILLHAHLPYVRNAAGPIDEERWLFEAITESYVPLIRTFQQLSEDRVPARFTLSLSPTLVAMLRDELLRGRYLEYLQGRISLAESLMRGRPRAEAPPHLAEYYRDYFLNIRDYFVNEWKCDLTAQVRDLSSRGVLELVATAATHALLSVDRQVARAQIAIGLDSFRRTFATDPVGFWLPECAYVPGLENLLARDNVRWFVVDSHAFERASPRARRGPFAPIFTPGGTAAFAREPNASRQIWDGHLGYPGDFSYRDFYRDAGFDLPKDALPSIEAERFTGLKCHRITGREEPKDLYDPTTARETARQHGVHFVRQQLTALQAMTVAGGESIIVAPFDAELFGHWWFEGPCFLGKVARVAAEYGLALTTPSDFLARNPTQQVTQPAESSWGDGGFLDVWLDEKCAWLYPPLHLAREKLTACATRFSECASTAQDNILREMARHLLLAQASDWPFLIRNGTAAAYAGGRVREHLESFHRLANSLQSEPDQSFTTDFPSLFPDLNWRIFAE